MKHQESSLQIACVKWFRMVYREPDYLICTFPNGGSRSIITAQILKAEGSRAGMPDLVIFAKSKCFFIEMKASKGVLSENQKVIHEILQKLGFMVYICRSFDEFKNVVENEILN